MNDLIRESEPLIRGVTHETLAVDLRLCDANAIALIDATQFQATLLNLIVNAVDATPSGGRITVETGMRMLAQGEIPGLAAGQYFSLRVADTGQGMSQDVMSRIFEPFFTTKAPGKGTGLGLSQVYGFVRQSGGEVRVQSTVGQGTCFSVYLPIVERQPEEMSPERGMQRGPEKLLQVLLTEDDASVAAVTEVMLRNLGHEVVRAENAEQALRVLRSERPLDLLLSDIIMPGGINGVELAREAVTLRPGLKILLSSGYAGEAVNPASAGSWPLLKKPYLQEELAEYLHQLYERSERVA